MELFGDALKELAGSDILRKFQFACACFYLVVICISGMLCISSMNGHIKLQEARLHSNWALMKKWLASGMQNAIALPSGIYATHHQVY
jgi:hypothetical protein